MLSLLITVPQVAANDTLPTWLRVSSVALGPVASFSAAFVVVFLLALAFPPSNDELSAKLEFKGARWIVWPIVLFLAIALAVW